jgi:hypothetical protein
MQLVFGRDAMLNINHVTDWEHIRQRKQKRINANNERENARRLEHAYKIGESILLKRKKNSKHELEYEGPYPLTAINDNGTVRFKKGILYDVVILRRFKPYKT